MHAIEAVTAKGETSALCQSIGVSRASLYRRRRPTPPAPPRRPRAPSPRALVTAERRAVRDTLRSARFVDQSPAEVYATLLEEQTYLCSPRTMYRVLAEAERAMSKPVNRRPDRDESPFAEQDADIEQGVRSLLDDGESAVVEFKSTARCNLHTGASDPVIAWAVIKTIAAFMNTHGGTLLIGVDDHGRPAGIEPDYPLVKGRDRDGWELWLTAVVKTALGIVAATDLPVRFCTIDDRTIARIDVRPGAEPVFATRPVPSRYSPHERTSQGRFFPSPQQLDGGTLGTGTARLPT